jgi:DNA-binding MarR family transcriptional regulator
MVASGTVERVEELAQSLFGALSQLWLAVPRGRRRNGDLKEVEYLTLSILHQHETRIVGDIQRLLGVLPAQMSRIIRSLEARQRPLISCRINPNDKRKIDVCLTPAGEQALLHFQAQHLQAINGVLRNLAEEDQEDLLRLLDKLNGLMDRPAAGANDQ